MAMGKAAHAAGDEARPAALSLTDEEAMLRLQRDGDRRAFGLIVRRWEGPIFRLCARMTGDLHRGEDLAQTAFARLFEKAGAYRHGGRVSTFLWRIAVNLCLDEQRRSGRRPTEPLDGLTAGCEPASDLPSPSAAAARHERAELVRRALERLSERTRAVVVLRHYEGLKFREIAEVLDIPVGTVKSRMADALDRLSALLGPALGDSD
jgi:RNA polymerase sigma-70 factor (ECF subfamily)